MDKIFIEDLKLWARVGVTEAERSKCQELLFTLVIWVDLAQAAETDRITNTINYSELKHRIAVVVAKSERCLLENLGKDILNCILNERRITRAAITIRKTKIWDNGVPGVTIYQRQTKT